MSASDALPHHPTALTIAGSDSGGGAGIQADLKTFAAHQVFGVSALCAITAQNPREVPGIVILSPEIVLSQLDALGRYFTIHAVKTGMLATAEIVEAVAEGIRTHLRTPLPLVVDPVMVSSSNERLLEKNAVDAMKKKLFPLATLLTPNLEEAGDLLERDTRSEISDLARALYDAHGTPVLLKGGHLPPHEPMRDYFYDGTDMHEFAHARVQGVNVHGTGCTLSAAITANLSQGTPLAEAIEKGITYTTTALQNAIPLGGEKFLNHHGG